MRTFAQKPKATQQTTSAKSAIPDRAHFGPGREVNSILPLQRTIGNQAVLRTLQTNAEEPKAGLTGTASPRFEHDFGRIPIHHPASGTIQTKLAINKPEDIYEQEADSFAEQVMHTTGLLIHRQNAEPSVDGVTNALSVPPIVHDVLNGSGGQPLDVATRAFMEPRFGRDFSHVRVHIDSKAAESAEAVNALAYTVGRDLVFGPGRYIPATSEGRKLVAHELTHVLQQTGCPNITPTAPMIQRQLLFEGPSAEVPNLSQDTVQLAHAAIARGHKQQAIDIIVNEMVRTGQIDRAKLLDGRVRYDPSLGGEGETVRPGFRREPGTGELTALRRPVSIGDDAFRNVPWLYSSILHEYQHVLQLERPSGLRTIESVVPGQQSAKLYRMQRDVEAYATEILRAHETGVDRNPFDVRDLWERLHNAWSYLDPAKMQALKDLYRQAHSRAESIPGVGTLSHFTPLP